MAGKPYRPDYISRKLFDKYQDRMDLRIARLKEDFRNDIALIKFEFQKLMDQQTLLFPIEEEPDDEGDRALASAIRKDRSLGGSD